MNHKRSVIISCFFVIGFSLIIPSYADVLSFKTDKTFYGKTGTIVFSGSVEEEDYGELVTIVIEDPSGNFVQLIQVFPDIENNFEKSISVSKFYTDAGIYNATAFINDKTNGKIIDFDLEKQRPIVIPPSESTPEPDQPQQDDVSSDTQNDQNSGTISNEKSIQEKIKERIEAAKKIKELQNMSKPTNGNQDGQTPENHTTENPVPKDISTDTKNESPGPSVNEYGFDSSMLYVILGVVGAGGVGATVYIMRNKPKSRDYSQYFPSTEKTETSENSSIASEDDYALMILKNRLAKGEIAIDEFNELKKALKEP